MYRINKKKLLEVYIYSVIQGKGGKNGYIIELIFM